MRYIALIEHGPAWLAGRSVYEQGPAIEAHLVCMRSRFDDGSLLLGGPFASHTGGIAVLDLPDLEAARRFMDSDPGVAAGVMTYRLETVLAYFDAFSRHRTTATASELGPP
jgi:uncharacterized protein YciI